jgi:Skp family chaperone for outer membrane proteins
MAVRKRTFAELLEQNETVKDDLKPKFRVSDAKLEAINKEVEDVKQMLDTNYPFKLKVFRTDDVPIAT